MFGRSGRCRKERAGVVQLVLGSSSSDGRDGGGISGGVNIVVEAYRGGQRWVGRKPVGELQEAALRN
jgi:hypothetical protein